MKLSIVTPVYNGEKYLAETIESVLSQEGDFEVEYIIKDGGSNDDTVKIIKSYDEKLRAGQYPIKCSDISFKWYSGKDLGMYDAINKGFEGATGEIYAWINSDDLYLPGAFSAVIRAFEAFPEVEWLKGEGFLIDESSKTREEILSYAYRQDWIARGFYGTVAPFIPQETAFWCALLWRKSGGIDKTLKLAGDYSLWIKFARYAPLWTLDVKVSCFRTSDTQLTHTMGDYRKEQQDLLPHKDFLYYIVEIFFWIKSKTKWYPGFSVVLYKIFFGSQREQAIYPRPDNTIEKRTVDSYLV